MLTSYALAATLGPTVNISAITSTATNIGNNMKIGDLLKGKDGGLDIINLVFIIVGLIFFANLIMVGWEYMMSSGDPKKTQSAGIRIVNGLIGLILAFVAFIVVRLITNILGLGTLV